MENSRGQYMASFLDGVDYTCNKIKDDLCVLLCLKQGQALVKTTACVDILIFWIFGYLNIWIFGYLDIWDIWIFRYLDM